MKTIKIFTLFLIIIGQLCSTDIFPHYSVCCTQKGIRITIHVPPWEPKERIDYLKLFINKSGAIDAAVFSNEKSSIKRYYDDRAIIEKKRLPLDLSNHEDLYLDANEIIYDPFACLEAGKSMFFNSSFIEFTINSVKWKGICVLQSDCAEEGVLQSIKLHCDKKYMDGFFRAILKGKLNFKTRNINQIFKDRNGCFLIAGCSTVEITFDKRFCNFSQICGKFQNFFISPTASW